MAKHDIVGDVQSLPRTLTHRLGGEKQSKDLWPVLFRDPRTVVLNPHLKSIRAGGLNVDPDLRHNTRFLAGVQGIVHRFLDGGEQGFARVVKSEQVAVLGKKLAHRDIALLGRHRGGRPAATR